MSQSKAPPSLDFPSTHNNMDASDEGNASNCTDGRSVAIVEGVMGSVGAVMCIIALIIVLASRFYKDTVQRLIVYKLIVMLIYSLAQLLNLGFDNSNAYRSLISNTAYCINSVLTLWLTIILYLCIVHLKELRNLKKLEPVAIINSCLPLAIVAFLPFTSYDDCLQTWQVIFSKGGRNRAEYVLLTGYSIAGITYFIISMFVVAILIKVVTRSRLPLQGIDDNQAESPLLTNNKWKTLSKQLLPLVVYPVVNTVAAMILCPLAVLIYGKFTNASTTIPPYSSLKASLGLITSIIVILHLCILKCKKKQVRRKKEQKGELDFAEAAADERSDVFTSYTIASTNAKTEYHYQRTSSYESRGDL